MHIGYILLLFMVVFSFFNVKAASNADIYAATSIIVVILDRDKRNE